MIAAHSAESSAPWYLRPWITQGLLLAITLALLLPGTAQIPLMDRDEPRFAQATWEMIERGEWFIPYFNEGYRFDKPVGSYWWMRIHFWIFGKTELAARLHSILSAWLTAMVIQAIGTFLYSQRAGFWAATGWLTCLQVLIHGRLCVADMPMLLGVTLSLWGLCRLLVPDETPPRWNRWFWVLLGGQVLGFLVKGPIALFVPLLGMLLARFVFYRRPIDWMRLQPIPLILLYLAGIGIWGIPALIMTQGQFWDEGMGTHVIERGTAAFNGRVIVPGFYLVSALLSLLPWSALLPAAFGPNRDARRSLPGAILLGIFLAPLIIFTPYATQLPHYILPGFPAFFLLLMKGGGIPKPRNFPPVVNRAFHWISIALAGFAILSLLISLPLTGSARTVALVLCPVQLAFAALLQGLSRSWFFTIAGTVTLGSLVFLLAVSSISWSPEVSRVGGVFTLAGLLFLLAGALTFLICSRHIRLVLALVLAAIFFIASLGYTLRSIHPVVAIHEILEEKQASDVSSEQTKSREFRAWKFTEPSLVFYTKSGWEFKGKDKELVTAQAWVGDSDNRCGVFLLKEWTLSSQLAAMGQSGAFSSEPSADYEEEVLEGLPEDEFELHRVKGLNIARSSWVELLVAFPRLGQ